MLSQRIHIQQKLCMHSRCVLIILSLCTNTALDSISSYILLYSPEASQRSIKLGITVFIRSLSPVKLGVSDVISESLPIARSHKKNPITLKIFI